jgi:hypothetical protein
MATVIKTDSRKAKCPCCGTNVDANDLGRAGITPEIFEKLGRYIHDGVLEEMLSIAESAKRQMSPSSTSLELVMTEKIDQLRVELSKEAQKTNSTLNHIVGGTGKGEIAEMLTSETLRQLFPQDEFDTTTAAKGGSDLVAKVFDRKTEVGKITISVKNTKTWKTEFLEQLEKNMGQDNTKVGILVSNKLAKKANPTGEPYHNKGGLLYFVVHPDNVKSLYVGLRQVVIRIHETNQYITNKEQELMRINQISKALVQWTRGDEYKEIQNTLDFIDEESDETTKLLQKTLNTMTRDIKKANDRQSRIRQHVLNQQSLLGGLRNLLGKSGDEE